MSLYLRCFISIFVRTSSPTPSRSPCSPPLSIRVGPKEMFFISSETKQRASGKLLGMQSSPDLRHENTPHPKVIQLPTYCTQSFPTYKNIIISHSFPWTCCQGIRGYSIGNREMQQGEGGAGSPASVVPSRSPSGRESLNRLLYFLPCK